MKLTEGLLLLLVQFKALLVLGADLAMGIWADLESSPQGAQVLWGGVGNGEGVYVN